MDSEKSLLGKLLMDYTSSIAPSTSKLSLVLLMGRTVAHVQAGTNTGKNLSTTF